MGTKYKFYITVVLVGIVAGVYVIHDMFVDWLEFGEMLRYILIRLPLAMIILLLSLALRRRYLISQDANTLKSGVGLLLKLIVIVASIVSILLLLPPNVYYWFVV